MSGNVDRALESERELGFGQVASLVALLTLCYGIFLSYQGEPKGLTCFPITYVPNKDYRIKKNLRYLPESGNKEMEVALMM